MSSFAVRKVIRLRRRKFRKQPASGGVLGGWCSFSGPGER